MSKMGQLAMELDEQAVALGFKDYADAFAHGYRAKTVTIDGRDYLSATLERSE